jgi:hypothetical protein
MPASAFRDMDAQDVRSVLQSLQDGYTHRDAARLDEAMALFVDDAELEVIGTSASASGQGEWCLGPLAARELVESDWSGWGDLSLDVAGARIYVRGDVAWLATEATVTQEFGQTETYEEEIEYLRDLLDREAPPRQRLTELVRNGLDVLLEAEEARASWVWPLRFTAVLVRDAGCWRFHQMHFSFPTTRFPDVTVRR